MKISDRAVYLQNNHFGEWLKARKEVEDEISKSQSLLCACGRLATGFHEMNCRKFQSKITSETVKRLKHLTKPGLDKK